MPSPDWWIQPRTVSIVVDNESWFIPYAERLRDQINNNGDKAVLCRAHDDVKSGHVAFYLACIHLTPGSVLERNEFNLVVHESNLPKGRGFSPVAWQIVEGNNRIPICLFQMVNEADAGPVVYRDELRFEGHELLPEIREEQGHKTIQLCLKFLSEPSPPKGEPQQGVGNFYPRRTDKDNEVDVNKTIAEQFNIFRVSNNNLYPVHFTHNGRRYILKVEKCK